MPVLLKIMVEEDKGWLPSAPLDMKYDSNRHVLTDTSDIDSKDRSTESDESTVESKADFNNSPLIPNNSIADSLG